MHTPRRLTALAVLLALLAGCAARPVHTPEQDAAEILRLSHAEDRFNIAMREFAQRQIERNPELKPFFGAIDNFWREQVRWADVGRELVQRYNTLYTPEELLAIRQTLESPLGDRVIGHADTLNREIAGATLQAVQDGLPALQEHLRAMNNAIAAGRSGELTPEQDFLAVKEAAEGGDASAQLLLAEKLLAGVGTPRDTAAALAWLEKSAAQDHAPALDLLASLHYRGAGVPRDFARARQMLERAAARNYLPAVNNLAWLLSTCPDDALRDGARALALIEPLIDSSPQMGDTLAAAYAEAGDYPRAVQLQKRAIVALGNMADPKFAGFLERLARYASGQPWRDSPTAPAAR